MSDPSNVLATVQDVLERDFKIPKAKATPEATFRGNLGMDSLDAVDLVYLLCKQYGLKANLAEWRELHTVAKVVDFLSSKVAAKAP